MSGLARWRGSMKIETDEDRHLAEVDRYREALKTIASFGDVSLASEWEPALRGIIRSMTDCAKSALRESV